MTISSILFPVLSVIPDELILRDFSVSKIIGLGLFISFILIAVSKLIRSDVFSTLLIANGKISSINQYIHESHPINKGDSIVLLTNYFLSFSLILLILFQFPSVENIEHFLLVFFTPICLLLFSLVSVYLVSALTGEYKSLLQLIQFRIIGVQYLGLAFFALGMVWTLTDMSLNTLLLISILILGLEFVVRSFKSIVSIFQLKFSWYYIILYFCTLEILPLVVIFYFFIEEFQV